MDINKDVPNCLISPYISTFLDDMGETKSKFTSDILKNVAPDDNPWII